MIALLALTIQIPTAYQYFVQSWLLTIELQSSDTRNTDLRSSVYC